MISISAGDWVRIPSLWPGIWHVSRILAGFNEDRWSLDEPLVRSKRRLLFCHRIVNDTWQRSFSHQSCEISQIHSLSAHDRKRIKTLLASNEKLIAAFEKYQATVKLIDRVANLGFGDLSDEEARALPLRCSDLLSGRIESGLTLDDVLHILRETGLESHKGKLPQQATLQLISAGHELRNRRFVYRSYRTLAS